MRYASFPIRVDEAGRTALVSHKKHVEEMIEAVLFTSPGERVNRPDFGSGLLQMVFAPANDMVAGATQFLVQGSLQRYLGDLVDVLNVEVQALDGMLEVNLVYVLKRTGETVESTFQRSVA